MKTKLIKVKSCFPYIEYKGKGVSGKIHMDGNGYYTSDHFSTIENNHGTIDDWIRDIKN
jgi:hypothetical protein